MRVMRFEHRGIAAALPPTQVRQAQAGRAAGAPRLLLWDGTDDAARDTSQLVVSTANGDRRLACTRPRLASLVEETEQVLPPILSGLMGLPHVVGCAHDEEGELVWLVDLSRVAI